MSVSNQECSTHCKALESFCKTCNISACRDCKHFISCCKNKHDVIPMRIAVDAFNLEATEVLKMARDIKQNLEDTFNSIFDDKSDYQSHLDLCKTTIEIQTKTIIDKVQEKCNKLMLELENLYTKKNAAIENQVKELESQQTQAQSLMASVTKMMNKPEEKEKLVSSKTSITGLRQKVLITGCNKREITPHFIPLTHLDGVINIEGIGQIISVDNRYRIDKDDPTIIVTKGQSFDVKVSRITKSDACQLAATLRNSSGEESAAEVEYQGSGEYRIRGRCNKEGDWQMNITAGEAHIKGSPVNIKVEKAFVHTIDNIADYKIHNREHSVTDVVVDKDGFILVASSSNDILKFNQTGSFVARIPMPNNALVNRMHLMDNGHMVYSDYVEERVVICDDEFHEIRTFRGTLLHMPIGVTVNKETRVLYITDCNDHCVFKFNVDDGRLLGKIGSEGSKTGQMMKPLGVTLNKEGHIIVAEYGNDRIQIFDANDRFMKILVDSGKEDGKVWRPRGITIDMDGNLIVSSDHKIQLFDKNGAFIKRIDHMDDGLSYPVGIDAICNRPRRVAVANFGENNVKIFNY